MATTAHVNTGLRAVRMERSCLRGHDNIGLILHVEILVFDTSARSRALTLIPVDAQIEEPYPLWLAMLRRAAGEYHPF